MTETATTRPTVGVFGLTGCSGDQLVILNCEDELLDVLELVDMRDFVTAASQPDTASTLDIAFVEGAVVTAKDEELLRKVRARSKTLVALGTCAVWGGVPGITTDSTRRELLDELYGEAAEHWDAEPVRALRDVVEVDAVITGCPIEKHEFLRALSALLAGNLPTLPQYPVCTECRIRENRCLLNEDGAFCVGPLTRAGCAARCPSQGVACIGCRGPSADANFESATRLYLMKGYGPDEIALRLGTFAPVDGVTAGRTA